MAEFKQSNLICKLEESAMLSQDAWDFVDACMDDFCVDEEHDPVSGELYYELRGTMVGWRDGKEVRIKEVYYADLGGMAALIEHLALMQMLRIELLKKKISEDGFQN